MSAAQQKAVGEMIDAASEKIAQKVVAGLEERVKSLETALATSQKEIQQFFAGRDITMMETLATRDADMLSKLAILVEVSEGNISMQMDNMKGAIEQIRDKDMEVSSDDGFYSEDEEEEEEKVVLSYEQVEGLCETRNTGEDERQECHRQAALKAAEQGLLNERALQALGDQRDAEYTEMRWALAEAQQGLVEAGSQMAVQDLVTGAQEVADRITEEALKQRSKAVQDQMEKLMNQHKEGMAMLETETQRIAEVAKQHTTGKNRGTVVAVERGGKAGKPLKKGNRLLAQKQRSAVGWN